MYCYLEFKLHYDPKNLKLFSIRIISKRIIWALSFAKKGEECLFFLKAVSWETHLWVTLGWFCAKKTPKIGNGNLYLIKNWLCRNKISCVEDNQSYELHVCKTNSQIWTLIMQLLVKCWFFKKLSQIWYIQKILFFLKYNWNFLDQLLLPCKFMAVAWEEYFFLMFPVVIP